MFEWSLVSGSSSEKCKLEPATRNDAPVILDIQAGVSYSRNRSV